MVVINTINQFMNKSSQRANHTDEEGAIVRAGHLTGHVSRGCLSGERLSGGRVCRDFL